MSNSIIDKVHMPSMVEIINNMQSKGFVNEFSVNESGQLMATGPTTNTPSQVKIIDFFRFEGESDPADESVLYALETDSGLKGLLSHIYGREHAEENQYASNFIKQVMVLHQEHPLATDSSR